MIKVSVNDFGPVVSGTVQLKPLTIFVGPSNAGKSYLAAMIYSLMQALDELTTPSYLRFPSYQTGIARAARIHRAVRNLDYTMEVTQAATEAIYDWARSIGPTRRESTEISFIDLPVEVSDLVSAEIRNSFKAAQHLFNRELQRCHGGINDIRSRRAGANQLKIGLDQAEPLLKLNFEEDQGARLALSKTECDISQATATIPPELIRLLRAEASRQSHGSEELRAPRDPDVDFMDPDLDFLLFLMQGASTNLLEGFPSHCYYLPAARSGIAQGHKAIASILVRQSSLAAIRPLEIPTLPGIITDFMGHILTMERTGSWNLPSGSKPLRAVVNFMEREVLQGGIDIERGEETTYPEISYFPIAGQPDIGRFPFHKTSSMVSELAPVVLFLKYLVRPGDLVILEEPESHLHPASQRQMARGIVRLVNAGVQVIITTHSDYFIGQVNNLLKLSQASKQKRTNEGYAVEDCLKPNDLGVYHFLLDEGLGGSVVKELPIIPGFGIEEEDFAAVSEALYEETVSLQRIRAR